MKLYLELISQKDLYLHKSYENDIICKIYVIHSKSLLTHLPLQVYRVSVLLIKI